MVGPGFRDRTLTVQSRITTKNQFTKNIVVYINILYFENQRVVFYLVTNLFHEGIATFNLQTH